MVATILDSVGLAVEIAPGADRTDAIAEWPWLDITDKVFVDEGVSIEVGRSDESSHVDPGRCSLVLDNSDGRFCRTNPNGTYYPDLTKNTPLRVRIRPVLDAFGRTASSGWGTADSGQAWTTSGGSATDYSVSSGAGRMLLGSTNVSRRATLGTFTGADYDVYAVVASSAVATGNPLRASILFRANASTPGDDHYRVQVNFEALGVITASLISREGAADSTLDTETISGTYAASTPVAVRISVRRNVITAWVYRVADGEPATPTFSTSEFTFDEGIVGCRALAATGNTNVSPVLTFDDFTVTVDRFLGEVAGWPPRWDRSGNLAVATIQANGILRRLAQGSTPIQSAMSKWIGDTTTAAWWPLESGIGQVITESPSVGPRRLITGPARVIPGLTAAPASTGGVDEHRLSGVIGGAKVGPLGALQAVDMSKGGQLSVQLPSSAFTTFASTDWRFELSFLFEDPVDYSTGATGQIVRINYRGGDSLIGVFGGETLSEFIIEVSSDAGFDSYTESTIVDDGAWHHLRIDMESNGSGANTLWTVHLDGVEIMSSVALSVPFGQPSEIVISPGGDLAAASHAVLWTGVDIPGDDGYDAFTGHTGERADVRLFRLCSENDVDYDDIGSATEDMGPQTVNDLLTLLRECEDADQGVLYEDAVGLKYQCHGARYNAPIALELDFDAGHLAEAPEPEDDDQRLRNDVTVSREGGGEVRYEAVGDYAPSGPVGRYDEQLTLNVETDNQLSWLAEWRVHLGTVDELRWPRLDLNLARSSELIQDWLNCQIGSRLTVDNPPSQVGPDQLDLFVEGYTEYLSYSTWRVSLTCSPASPWTVAVVEGAGPPDEPEWQLDSAESTLASSLTSSATSISVATTGAPLWTTTDVPLDIEIGGEQITISAISGASSPQTFTASARAVNGVTKAHSSGSTVRLWRPPVLSRS